MLRPRLPRRRALSLLLIVIAVGAGGVYAAWPRAPWTSLPAEAFPAVLDAYRAGVTARADVAPGGSFVITGHRLAGYQAYATNLSQTHPRPRDPRPAVELLTRAFTRYELDAVELDVHASPFDPRALVVVHDRVPDAPRARAYAEKSTLRAVLHAWLTDGWAARGKQLFVELKAPPGALDDEARSSADRLAGALHDVVGGRPDETRLRGQINLISFSVAALARARAGLGARAAAHTWVQVISSNKYPGWVFALAGRLPPFDDAAQKGLRTLPWLGGVFFDPRFVTGFAHLFNGINAARVAAGLRPLDLHVSTYSHQLPGLLARLDAAGERLKHVKGLIVQVREPAR